ncbi:S8 family serine peptidase [Corallococcus sp. bb12-1]|uniref:S8 family serine peptidase n=1 Tax=Corallococcus sp. bb12-1 TaxID=2996784 RepID=UPI00226F365E|nr:S8 family serine peptidase [Corallococcus sp. bb12-1]MCY1041873.1 S8 family serine peptidase [Corallococcus sp. bb12-1]
MKKAVRASLLPVLLSSVLSACGGEVPTPGASFTADTALSESAAPAKNPRRFVPGQAIVKFKGSARGLADGALPPVRGFQAQLVKPLSSGSLLVALEPEQRSVAPSIAEEEARTLEAIEELRRNPDVEYAHENLYMEFFATPTDPLYSVQWNYPAINLPTAWNTVTGNVKIAVLDSGRLNHPDLIGAWTGGYDFGDGDADPTDTTTYHHGLHVAGILAARTNNGVGGAGVCWGCQLMPVKVSNASNSITLAAVDDAIRYAADNGARVINMSFGTAYNVNFPTAVYPCSNYADIQSAVTYATGKGVVVVAAAGNDGVAGLQAANITPASCTGVIAVGASTQTGARATWSSGGSRVDVVAPGGTASSGFYGQGFSCPTDPNVWDPYSGTDQIVSAWAIGKPGATLLPGDYCHRYLSGTSMSSPHVAGLAALILSQKPSMTPAQVTARIKSTATAVSGCGSNCGTGRINASAAIYTNLPPQPAKGPWYNPARSGNGLDISHLASDQIHVTWFTYTATGTPIWYQSFLFAEPGEWRGDLWRNLWTGSTATFSTVGSMRITYTGGLWRLYWTLGALSGNEPIQFLAFGSGGTVMNLNGLWYNAAESGWGANFNTQGNTHVLNLTIYQGSNPVWVQGVTTSTSTSLSFPMQYITGTNLCPGCTGTTSTSSTAAGTFTVSGSAGAPGGMAASSAVSFPGGTWNRPSFTLNRLTGP